MGTCGLLALGAFLLDIGERGGQLALGAGTEIKLELINPNLWIFTEGTIAATKFGPTATKDDIAARTGLRFKF